ncbi:Fic family protein [Halomonas sp. AOP13-D3-9]
MGEFLKELDLTEGRSTGVPKILRVMKANGSPEPVFETDDERSFFLIRLPVHQGFSVDKEAVAEVTPEVTEQVGTKQGLSKEQVDLLQCCVEEAPITHLMKVTGRSNRTKFRAAVLNPLLDLGLIEMTQPDSPRSPTQKYRLTDLGKQVLATKNTHQ